MPNSQNTNVLLVFADMKYDPVNAIPFAEQQVSRGIAKLFRLRNTGHLAGSLSKLKMASNSFVSHLSA